MRPWKLPGAAGPSSPAVPVTSARPCRTGRTAPAPTRSASAGTGRQVSTTSASRADRRGSSSSTWIPTARCPRTGTSCRVSAMAAMCSPSSPNGPGSRGHPLTWWRQRTEAGTCTSPRRRAAGSATRPRCSARWWTCEGPAATSWRPGREWTASRMNCSMPTMRRRCLNGSASCSPPRLRPHRHRGAGAFRLARGCKDSSTRSGPVRPATATTRCTGRAAGQRK